jgi:hypothetical protein
MSQHDMDLANQAGAAFRSDLNNALAALITNSSGATAPTTTFANMWWYDTTAGLMKRRDPTNTSWVTLDPLALLSAVQSWTKAQRGTPVALTSSSASIAIDLSLANNFTHTTSENTTLAAPSNAVAGQSGIIIITQGATARTLAFNSFWKFAGGTVPTLTATIGAVDVFAYYVESGSRATCNLTKDVK